MHVHVALKDKLNNYKQSNKSLSKKVGTLDAELTSKQQMLATIQRKAIEREVSIIYSTKNSITVYH